MNGNKGMMKKFVSFVELKHYVEHCNFYRRFQMETGMLFGERLSNCNGGHETAEIHEHTDTLLIYQPAYRGGTPDSEPNAFHLLKL